MAVSKPIKNKEIMNAVEILQRTCIENPQCETCPLYYLDDEAEMMCGLCYDPCDWKIDGNTVDWGDDDV